MNIDNREKIEWLNYWIEDANLEKKRILLIGDSVTRELRKKMNMFMNREYAVDLIAMSYSVLDKMTLLELRHFFDVTDYKYDYILFNMGGHHGYKMMCIDSVEIEKYYTTKIYHILDFLKSQTTNLIAMSITLENPKKQYVENSNIEIVKRNEIIEKVAQSVEIEYLALNKKLDYTKLVYSDWCHFYEDAYEEMARIIIAEIFSLMICPKSNRIFSMEEFESIISQNKDKKIYIFGNGKRREDIETYLQRVKNLLIEGVIVSKQYMESDNEKIVLLDQVDKHDSIIIVTPYDAVVWKLLMKGNYNYISLGEYVLKCMKKS